MLILYFICVISNVLKTKNVTAYEKIIRILISLSIYLTVYIFERGLFLNCTCYEIYKY